MMSAALVGLMLVFGQPEGSATSLPAGLEHPAAATLPTSSDPSLVPPIDQFGLPAPLWVFQLLLPLTFFLHVVFMNLALGTAVLLGPFWWASKSRPHFVDITSRLLRVWPVALSMTITTGVAPLLFVQVLYGHMFYTGNILLGFVWFAIIILLLADFYAIYLVLGRAFEKPAEDSDAQPVLRGPSVFNLILIALIAVSMLAIAAIFTANSTLMLVPDSWRDVRDGVASPFWVHAMFVPRLMHNVIGSLAVTSLIVAVLARTARTIDDGIRLAAASTGLFLTAIFTGAQILSGFVFLLTIWNDAAGAFLDPTTGTLLWAVAVASGMAAFFVLVFHSINHPEKSSAVWIPVALITVTLAGMSAGRERLRVGMLSKIDGALYTADQVRTQPVTAWLFVGVLMLGLGLIALMLHWTYRAPRRSESGDA
ncbi:MAG: hypothetical protein O7F76_07705 [Planctomycetota bacterium]|nr:hypothetical protein [Planctomycetota bacterium]